MANEKPFITVLLTSIKKLIVKLVSIKNLIAIASIILGVVVISKPHISSSFKEWGDYMVKVLVIFFAGNQLQKIVFAKHGIPDNREEEIYEPEPGEPGDTPEDGGGSDDR